MTIPDTESRDDLLARVRSVLQSSGGTDERQAMRSLLNQIACSDDGFGQLARAGRFLQRSNLEPAVADVVDIVVTGSGSLQDLDPSLLAEFARHGLTARLSPTDFGSYHRTLLASGGQADITLCVLDASVLTSRLPSPWQLDDAEEILAALAAELGELVAGFVSREAGMLVLNTVPLPPDLPGQLIDSRARARLAIAWRAFDSALLRLAVTHDQVAVVDTAPLIAAGGPITDPRMALYARQHLGSELLGRYAREVAHLARTLRGQVKKVLVLDLDGTLWGGILAEDGAAGIEPAGTLAGMAFEQFQKVIRQLAAQGVLLAVSSKNDRHEVLAALAEHPDMTLRPDDFAVIEASWDPKPVALRRIADRLGLDPASFVFVDDSPTECGAVAAMLPGVAVVEVDDEPALHLSRLLADGWFDVRAVTEEDLQRAAHYRRQPAREQLLADSASVAEYLSSLGLQVRLAPVQEHEQQRASQLTQRTNQFNLTTERLAPSEVRDRIDDPDQLVFGIHSADRFGSDGLVGVVFGQLREGELAIRNLLLSCRVFDRNIEHAVVIALLEYGREMGLTGVRACYRPTEKNGRFADFYSSLGFDRVAEEDGTQMFRHDLGSIQALPQHLRFRFDREVVRCG